MKVLTCQWDATMELRSCEIAGSYLLNMFSTLNMLKYFKYLKYVKDINNLDKCEKRLWEDHGLAVMKNSSGPQIDW